MTSSARCPSGSVFALCLLDPRAAIAMASLVAATGCGGSQVVAPPPATKPAPAHSAAPDLPKDALPFSSIASAPEGTIGPYIAYGTASAMAAYSPGGESPRRWVVQPLGANGAPASAPKNLTDAPDDVTFAVLRADDAAARFALVWSAEGSDGSDLRGALIKADGASLSQPVEIAHAARPVLWADAIPVRDGFVVAWAEQDGGHARMLARNISASGALRGEPAVVESAALAWQAVSTGDGVAIAVVRTAPHASALGAVALHVLDSHAQRVGEPIAISDSPTAQLDVDLARVQQSLLIAWTDRRNLDSEVLVATTDLQGRIQQKPHDAVELNGDQALIDLVPPSDGAVSRALLIVDSLPHPSRDSFDATVVTLDASGESVGPSSRLALAEDAASDTYAVGAPGGFLMLLRGPRCNPGADDRALVPWFLRVGAEQRLTAGAPLQWGGPADVVASAWSPGCIGSSCFAVGVDDATPATVVTLRLDRRTPPCASPWKDKPDSAATVSNRSLLSLDAPVSNLAAASLGATSIVAWVTDFVEGPGSSTKKAPPDAPGDPNKPVAAEVGVQLIDETGRAAAPKKIVSVRAYSPGGIALSPDPATKDSCIAWVARDNGDPQVFLTKVGPDGAKKAQRMLTRARGDASDVALARIAGGWIVGWVDGRDGNGEVYVAKVDDSLRSSGPEVRVTQAPGDASEVSLLPHGDEILVAFGDTRDQPARAIAAPYYRRLRASNLAPLGEDRPIARTRLHSRAVRFLAEGDDLAAAWLEITVPGASTDHQERPGVRIVRFDPVAGQPVTAPTVVAPDPGEPTGYSAQCVQGSCRGLMSVDTGSVGAVDLFTFTLRGAASAPKTLLTLGGPPGADPSPRLIGDAVVYADVGAGGDHRIRRAQLRAPGP